MLKYIINNSIYSAIIFIILFELLLQHHVHICIYLMITYVFMKSTGFTDTVKKIFKIGWKIIFERFEYIMVIYSLKYYQKNFDFTFRSIDGSIEGSYIILNKNKKKLNIYWATVIKTKRNVKIRLWELKNSKRNSKPIELIATPFFINYENVMEYLNNHYFPNS